MASHEKRTRQILLNAFDMNCVTHIVAGTWRHPESQARRYKDIEQRRGVYKTEYTEGTLRHKLFGRGPRLPETHRAANYRHVTQEVSA